MALVASALAAPRLEIASGSPRVVITAAGGERTVCRRTHAAPPRCARSDAWYMGPGTYIVSSRSLHAEVALDGVEAVLSVNANREGSLRVWRTIPLPDGLSLEPAWSGALGDRPVYRLRNTTNEAFWYLSAGREVGRVQRRSDQGWEVVSPRVECGNSYEPREIPPGAELLTAGRPGSELPQPLSPGEFRYVVTLYDQPVALGTNGVIVRTVTELTASFTLAE